MQDNNTVTEPARHKPVTPDEPTSFEDEGSTDPQSYQISSLFAHLGASGSNANIDVLSVDEVDV